MKVPGKDRLKIVQGVLSDFQMIKEVNNSYYKPPQDICSFKFQWVKIDKVLMTKFFPFNIDSSCTFSERYVYFC